MNFINLTKTILLILCLVILTISSVGASNRCLEKVYLKYFGRLEISDNAFLKFIDEYVGKSNDPVPLNGILAELDNGKMYLVFGKPQVTYENLVKYLSGVSEKKVDAVDWLGEIEIIKKVNSNEVVISKVHDYAGFLPKIKLAMKTETSNKTIGKKVDKAIISALKTTDKKISIGDDIEVIRFPKGHQHVNEVAEVAAYFRQGFADDITFLSLSSDLKTLPAETKRFKESIEKVKNSLIKLKELSANGTSLIHVSWSDKEFNTFNLLVNILDKRKGFSESEFKEFKELSFKLYNDFGYSSQIDDIVMIPVKR